MQKFASTENNPLYDIYYYYEGEELEHEKCYVSANINISNIIVRICTLKTNDQFDNVFVCTYSYILSNKSYCRFL